MHELITSVASVIILSLFVLQFAFNENLFLELTTCDKVISEFEQSGEYAAEDIKLLDYELDRIPNVTADISDGTIELTIENIVVPMWNTGENQIRIERRLRHEEPNDNDGSDTSDEYPFEGSD